jgi:hypothetical protein
MYKRIDVFYAYAPKDETWVQELVSNFIYTSCEERWLYE